MAVLLVRCFLSSLRRQTTRAQSGATPLEAACYGSLAVPLVQVRTGHGVKRGLTYYWRYPCLTPIHRASARVRALLPSLARGFRAEVDAMDRRLGPSA